MIRSGYRNRNPSDVEKWYAMLGRARENLETTLNSDGRRRPGGMPSVRDIVQAHATGLSIEGLSGVGKTTSVKRILSLYPQVIEHEDDSRRMATTKQLVWLMITCPGDGGVVGLARAILRAFDVVLETNHLDDYTRKRASAETMRAAAVSLAHLHALGILVIDEIQILHRSKSDNVEGIMNFLLTLMNDLRVPVVVVGTAGAAKFLSGEMQTGRRFSGAGHFPMRPLRREGELEVFVSRIWGRSLLRENPKWADLSPTRKQAFVEAFWLMTAGVHDLVMKGFLFAQYHALERGLETLTPQVFQEVYERDFKTLHGILGMMHGNRLVDDIEWDEIRKSFAAEGAPGTGTLIGPPPLMAQGTAEPTSSAPAKRVKKRKPSPPHRKPKEDSEAEIEARMTLLQETGILGAPVTGAGGDFKGG
jgi:hypothetical protein